MLAQPLKKAAEEFGKYCPERNELLVRKGRKTHRLIFGKSDVRIVSPAKPEVVIYFAPDITVRELKNLITFMTASMES